MITIDSKSNALVREHHLACRLDELLCQRLHASIELFTSIIKKQNVLKKKILIATVEGDEEAMELHNQQISELDRVYSSMKMRLLDVEIETLKAQSSTLV